MIKKYITLAALLSAGTAFANASDSDYVITTGFTKQFSAGNYLNYQSASTLSSLNNSELPETTAVSKTSKPWDSGGQLPGDRFISGSTNMTTPYQNTIGKNMSTTFVGTKTKSPWNFDIYYGSLISDLVAKLGANESLRVDKVELNLGAYTQLPSPNGWVWLTSQGGYATTNVTLNFNSQESIAYKVDKGGTTNAPTGPDQTASAGGNGPEKTPTILNPGFIFDENTLVGSDTKLTVKFDPQTDNKYVGIYGVKVYLSVIPEPSAFGLLAGLGALALVASRRRRK